MLHLEFILAAHVCTGMLLIHCVTTVASPEFLCSYHDVIILALTTFRH